MKVIKKADKKTYERSKDLTNIVADIIDEVRQHGDETLIALTKKFDGIDIEKVKVEGWQIEKAYEQVSEETILHIKFAAKQIKYFAEEQLKCIQPLNLMSEIGGLEIGHRLIPVEKCGCYIPSGRYPLPSSALMSVIVAKVAGVKHVAACSPPFAGFGMIHPTVLVAMDIAGADEIYCMGGAQAIAAYAYGTETVTKVDLIVGPGNKYVTEAKRQVLGDVGIDSLAGPSEVLIIADETANPTFIAIDLLAQAEHDPNAKSILVSTSEEIIEKSMTELERLIPTLPTGQIAHQAWLDNGDIFLVDNIEEAIKMSNEIAPEHLEVHVANEREVAQKLLNYGSLFVGHYASVALGDFVSGTNHILPTMSTARFASGVWVGTFIKTSFHQFVSQEGCKNLAVPCMHFAEIEGLYAHRDSIRLRVEK
ncbi:histidinol dehydrogenase 1 [Clostridium aceticum]|uniref:Histidinol dehydrogenase 1 n=1 Tax=Clostridium aceticum TaxID=84022 RepID=A0A0D8IER7_9CLOT|nr:histidinol dehydrogenase [Clostridium aceticum]AKL94752.1 histidinol dehydrogenase 1 [Clostridium aceticum]KJF27701.1 histidinol dehydrogenase [Clostridium aceticum]